MCKYTTIVPVKNCMDMADILKIDFKKNREIIFLFDTDKK